VYDARNLVEIATRIKASLQHQEAAEEFVTAVLSQVSTDGHEVEILSSGHPPPLLARGDTLSGPCRVVLTCTIQSL
jgi:serine phosphatase RsbU (regulator of sigma subunit)